MGVRERGVERQKKRVGFIDCHSPYWFNYVTKRYAYRSTNHCTNNHFLKKIRANNLAISDTGQPVLLRQDSIASFKGPYSEHFLLMLGYNRSQVGYLEES